MLTNMQLCTDITWILRVRARAKKSQEPGQFCKKIWLLASLALALNIKHHDITDMMKIKKLNNGESLQNQIFIGFQTIHIACTLLDFAPQAIIFFLHERFQLAFSFFPEKEKSLRVIVTFSTIKYY